MKFEINVPDQVIAEDPAMKEYVRALQMMADRMSVSHFKYGPIGDKYPESASGIDGAMGRVKMYVESHNTENCLDAANFLIIEHLFPDHEEAHFRAQTSKESPGLAWK